MINILIYSCFISLVSASNPDYEGNWPYNEVKDNILKNSNTNKLDCPNGIGCECINNDDCINNNCEQHLRGKKFCSLKSGDTFPHFIAKDQFNQLVDIYDFANNDKYILIEMGATWCSPCNLLASWFAYGEEDIKSTRIWRDSYENIYEYIKNDQVYFITILYEDEFKDNANFNTVYEWYDTYPDDDIPILADENKLLHTIIKPTGIPAVTLVGPDMKIINLSTRGFNKSFDKLIELMEE